MCGRFRHRLSRALALLWLVAAACSARIGDAVDGPLTLPPAGHADAQPVVDSAPAVSDAGEPEPIDAGSTCPAGASCTFDCAGTCIRQCPGPDCTLRCPPLASCILHCSTCQISCASVDGCALRCVSGQCQRD
jgi:hypothetical protein